MINDYEQSYIHITLPTQFASKSDVFVCDRRKISDGTEKIGETFASICKICRTFCSKFFSGELILLKCKVLQVLQYVRVKFVIRYSLNLANLPLHQGIYLNNN